MGVATLILGSLTDAAFFVLAIRSVRRIQNEIKMMGGNLVTSVTASLRVIDARIRDTTVAAYGLSIGALLTALLFLAKYLTGDLHGLGAAVGSAATFIFVAAIAGAMGWRCKTHLLPRREELSQVLVSLEETN